MSNLVFPALPGLAWDIVRTPVWQTRKQQSVSGKFTTQADWLYPLWKLQLTYEFLRSGSQAELQQLAGFYNQVQGGYDTFLFNDPEDNSVTSQAIGITDGVNGAFQLIRTYGGFTEPVTGPNVVSSVTLNGAPFYAYTVDYTTGMLGLGEVQPAGYAIVATFTYYRRCRFSDDNIDFNNFMYQLHEVKQLNIETVR